MPMNGKKSSFALFPMAPRRAHIAAWR